MAAAVAAIAVTVPAGQGHAEDILTAHCTNGGGRLVTAPGSGAKWQVLSAPTFSPLAGIGSAPQDVTSYAVAPNDPALVVVTNGKSVYVSHSGGCVWEEGLRLDQVTADVTPPLSGLTTTIHQVAITGSGTILATAEELDNGATVGHPHVIRSASGARGSWSLGDNGLPPLGHPLLLRASRRTQNVVYLSFSEAREEDTAPPGGCPPAPLPCPGGSTGQDLGLLWGSTDGGANWSNRTSPEDLNGVSAIKYYSIDDNVAGGQTIWAVAKGRLRHSTNGGRSYTDPDGLNQTGFQFTAVEALLKVRGSAGIDLVAFSSSGGMIRRDHNKWVNSEVPFPAVESAAQRDDGEIGVATTSARDGFASMWRIRPQDFYDYEHNDGVAGTKLKKTYGWEGIQPNGVVVDRADMTATSAGPSTYFVRAKRAILRFAGSTLRKPPILAPPADLVIHHPRGIIAPTALTVDLPVGGTKTVDYTLTLPPAPTPLEVFLLVDNSGSMQALIDDLKLNLADVARALNHAGIDVRMGVGKINVQPESDRPPIDDPRTPYVDEGKPVPLYERLRPIGAINSELFQQLSSLDGNGGSGDEAQLESLYQLVTGEGTATAGLPVPLLGYTVPPKQQAGFTKGAEAIRVVIHATDEEFSTNIRNGHGFADAIRVLNNAGIKQIGLSQGITEAGRDLRIVAKGTHALAPAGGVDCDGDGHHDLNPGQPLVCPENYGLDKTLVNLLNSLSDRQTISLYARKSDTLRSITRTEFAIDAKRATKQTFRVTFSCAGITPGSYTNELTAGLRGELVARAATTVNCGSPEQRQAANPPVPPGQGAVPDNPPPVPQPNPPVVPIAPAQPVAQPQTQVQSQSQMNPQAGMADQEQEQAQLALAGNDAGLPDNEAADELAMSALDPADPAARGVGATTVLAAGLGMTAAAGVALRRRTRTQYARAVVSRW